MKTHSIQHRILFLLHRIVFRSAQILSIAAKKFVFGNFKEVFPAHKKDEVSQLSDAGSQIGEKTQKQENKLEQGLEEEVGQKQGAAYAIQEDVESVKSAKSIFLANMTHELRTPLNEILGNAELMLNTDLNQEQKEYLENIKNFGDSLLTIINDILDFSKIEANCLELETIRFNFRSWLEATIKPLALNATKENVELICQIDSDVPDEVLGDPSRLRQVIVNLVNNGIKFTQNGEVVIRVSTMSRFDKEATLRFEIVDTGIGISREKQKMIFDAFSQANVSMNQKHSGTGLGLTISARFVELMGGKVRVESDPGKGSTFSFTVPLGIQDQGLAEPAPVDQTKLQGMKVLLVDNNATHREVLQVILEDWKMHSSIADSGKKALEIIEKEEKSGGWFPLIITDCHMPNLDGFEFVKKLNERPEFSATTIIMLTSGGERGDARRCRDLGISSYLTKPITQSELLAAITTAMGTKVITLEQSGTVTRHTLREKTEPSNTSVAEDNIVEKRRKNYG